MKKLFPLIIIVLLSSLSPSHAFRDLETGTFLTRDPIGYADGPNVYCYVHCNPITHFDAWGLYADVKKKEIDGEGGREITQVDISLKIAFRNETGFDVSASDIKKIADAIAKKWTGDFGEYRVTTTVEILGSEEIKKLHEAQESSFDLIADDALSPKAIAGKFGFNIITLVSDKSRIEPQTDAWGMRNQMTLPISSEGLSLLNLRSAMHEGGHLIGEDDNKRAGNMMNNESDQEAKLRNVNVDSLNIRKIAYGPFCPVSKKVREKQREEQSHLSNQTVPGYFYTWANGFISTK